MAIGINTRKLSAWDEKGALDVQNGFPCGNWNDDGNGVIQIRPFNVTQGGLIDLNKSKFIETDRKLDNCWLAPNDVVFNNTNSEELVGKTALWTLPDKKVVLSNHMTRIRVIKHNQLVPGFLAFLLLKQWEDGFFRSVCRRHVNQASVSKDQLLGVDVPNFEFGEQRQIARVLATVQRAIEQQQAIIDATRELKRTLMHKLFTEGLRGEPQKQTEIGPVPESWDVVPLSDCAVVQTGIAKGRRYPEGTQTVEVPYLRVANVQAGRLDLTEVKTIHIAKHELQRYALAENDVVLTEGGDFDKLGRGFVWQGEIDQCIHQNHVFAVRVDPEIIDPLFFAYQSQSAYGRAYFLSVAHKTTNLASINTSKLKAFPVLVPDRNEQNEIANILVQIDDKLALAERKHASYLELFKTLLHQLMTAQIRVHDLNLDALGVPALD